MSELKLRPLSNRVVVVTETPKQLSDGGLHIPSTAQEKPQIGTVFAVGPGKVSEFPVVHSSEFESAGFGGISYEVDFRRMPMVIKPGDKVLFGKYEGTSVQVDREEFLVLRETDILCLLEEEDES